jgi:hypothetical protein
MVKIPARLLLFFKNFLVFAVQWSKDRIKQRTGTWFALKAVTQEVLHRFRWDSVKNPIPVFQHDKHTGGFKALVEIRLVQQTKLPKQHAKGVDICWKTVSLKKGKVGCHESHGTNFARESVSLSRFQLSSESKIKQFILSVGIKTNVRRWRRQPVYESDSKKPCLTSPYFQELSRLRRSIEQG